MKLYHPDAEKPVDCHPSRIEHMKKRGWTEKPPQPAASQRKPATNKEAE